MLCLRRALLLRPPGPFRPDRTYAASATRKPKSALLQDPDRVPVYKVTTSSPSDRRCYVWGLSETGALGMHKSIKKQSQRQAAFIQHPTRLQFAERHAVLDIAAGYGFTAFAVADDDTSAGSSLFGCGINTDGQLGYQPRDRHPDRPLELVIYPAPIELPVDALSGQPARVHRCAAGRAHLLALNTDTGRVYTLGNNAHGQCGRPIIAEEQFGGDTVGGGIVYQLDAVGDTDAERLRIVDVHAGQDHSLFVTECGRVYACGWGADGQTGLGHYAAEARPTRVRGAIESERIVKVAGTVDCVLALSDGGEVFGWGNSEYGQLIGEGDEQQIAVPQVIEALRGCGKIVDVAAGGSSCIALNEHGDCFVWGYGLLGLGPAVDHQQRPTHLPATLFGRNEFSPKARVSAVYAGISHMAAVTDEQDVYVWGRNKFGCLGLGHQKDQFFPLKAAVGAKVLKVSCGVDHTVAMCKAFI